MRALIAVIFQEQGLSATRNFVISHFLNRSLNLAGLLKFGDPKRALAHTCASMANNHRRAEGRRERKAQHQPYFCRWCMSACNEDRRGEWKQYQDGRV